MKKLSAEAQNWVDYCEVRYILEPHQRFILQEAARVFDQMTMLNQRVDRESPTVKTERGSRKANPNFVALQSARFMFCKLLKQLDIDVEVPPVPGSNPKRKKHYAGSD
jgi:hypothetical protein